MAHQCAILRQIGRGNQRHKARVPITETPQIGHVRCPLCPNTGEKADIAGRQRRANS
jgi:hypothetical protein